MRPLSRPIPAFVVLFALLVLSCALSLLFGAGPLDLIAAVTGESQQDRYVLMYERLPRTALAALVGMALSASGLAFQAFLQNPLADPYIIGVAGGAALGGTLAIIMPFGFGRLGIAGAAFAFAVLATVINYGLSRDRVGRIRAYEVLLIGVVFNAFASAIIMFLKAVVRAERSQEMLLWLMGTLSSQVRGLDAILFTAAVVFLGLFLLLRLAPSLNALALGPEEAMTVGVDPDRTGRNIVLSASLLVAAAVSVAGLIGFVGLIVPHATRLLLGSDHRHTVPASALLGASFLVLADLGTRLLFPVFHTEAPVGVATAFIGGPLFVWLLKKTWKVK